MGVCVRLPLSQQPSLLSVQLVFTLHQLFEVLSSFFSYDTQNECRGRFIRGLTYIFCICGNSCSVFTPLLFCCVKAYEMSPNGPAVNSRKGKSLQACVCSVALQYFPLHLLF